ncbi:transporter substrate-binding domain-containing protein [Mesorhizobium sp. M1312]|uniref:substrate-binding periplasmic protein n=1 Tax=unclassified Mesorhizobium TaxID=325217 RepID=UPI00333B28E1
MKLKAATILVAALVGNAFATASQAQETISVGIDAAFAPFAFVKPNGDISGYEYDLVVAVCEKMNVTCNISNVPWDGIFASLEAGNIQWIGTGVTISDARKAQYTMSNTVYRVGLVMLVKKDAPVSSYDELKGKIIGTLASTEPWYAFGRAKLGEGVDIRGYDSIDAAVLDLDAGRISAVIGDNLQLQDQFVSKGGYKFVAEPEYAQEFTGAGRGWVFQKGNTELADKVNAALAEAVADGTHAEIGKRYFGTAVPAK